MAVNQTVVTKRVAYKEGKTWKTKTVSMDVGSKGRDAAEDLLVRALNSEHGKKGWKDA